MVHSLSFILGDLKNKIEKSKESLENIDTSKKHLLDQAAEVQAEINKDFAQQFEALQKRKEFLHNSKNSILAKESEILKQRKLRIEEIMMSLDDLLSMNEMAQDSREFRELYEKVIDQYAVCEKFAGNGFEMNFYADGQPVKEAISQFGTIFLEKNSNPGQESSTTLSVPSQCDSAEFIANWVCCNDSINGKEEKHDNAQVENLQKTMKEERAMKEKACELKGCCNCVDVCEKTLLPLKKMKLASKEEDLQKWLVNGKATPGNGSSSAIGSDLPVALQKLVDNQVLSQFESLKLSDSPIDMMEKQVDEIKRAKLPHGEKKFNFFKEQNVDQQRQSGERKLAVLDKWDQICEIPMKAWLKSSAGNSSTESNQEKLNSFGEECMEQQSEKLALLEKWDSIRAEPLIAWLKSDVTDYSSKGNQDDLDCKEVISEEVSDVKSSLRYWLKKDQVMDVGDSGRRVDDDASSDVKSSLRYWLKEDKVMDVGECRRRADNAASGFKSSPLQHWLKEDKVMDIEDFGRSLGNASPSVRHCNAPCKTPLFYWLKQKKPCSDAVLKKKFAKTLEEFEVIKDSPLHSWLKVASQEIHEEIKLPTDHQMSMQEDAIDAKSFENVMNEFEKIKATPLDSWLKVDILSKVKQAYPTSTPCPTMSINPRKRAVQHHSSYSKVRPELQQWLKKPAASCARNVDLQKWLKN